MSVDPCLAAYGGVVAILAPSLLARLGVDGSPRLGLAAWFIAATSAVMAWLGAALSLTHHPGQIAPGVGAGLLAGLSARLVWVTLRTWWENRVRRGRHAEAAVLLGRLDSDLGALIVDSPQPAAYCLPGPRGGMVVVTTGATSILTRPQLRAVLSHERAHLDGRHHVLLYLGRVLSRAFWPLPPFRQVGAEVARLVEMRADDAAARVHGRWTVAAAIATLGTSRAPTFALGAGERAAARALRLSLPPGASRTNRLALAATALLLAAGPFLAAVPQCPHPW